MHPGPLARLGIEMTDDAQSILVPLAFVGLICLGLLALCLFWMEMEYIVSKKRFNAELAKRDEWQNTTLP